jgi:hypothetical protein
MWDEPVREEPVRDESVRDEPERDEPVRDAPVRDERPGDDSEWGWPERYGLSRQATRQGIGLTCKAFLDVGRCLYLREAGFDARLTTYCSEAETPENRVLIANWVGS